MDYKKTILIVDDEKMILNLLSCNLIKEGYNVIEATDGVQAISMAQEKKPDLILLDVMLPKIDGLSVCKRVKNMMNVPILMVTARDEELDKIITLKPVTIEKLREILPPIKVKIHGNDIIKIIKEFS